jgi:hypothetical protein
VSKQATQPGWGKLLQTGHEKRESARSGIWSDISQITYDGFESLPGTKEGGPGGRIMLEPMLLGIDEFGRCRGKEARNPRSQR